MLKRIIAIALGFGAVMTALPAQAASCAERDKVVTRLQQEYAEELTAGGLNATATKTTVVEVWSSPETGTFTVMLTNAQGMSCIVATGTDWFAREPELVREDTAS